MKKSNESSAPQPEMEDDLTWWQEQLDFAHEDLLAACTTHSPEFAKYSRELVNHSIDRCGSFFEELIIEVSRQEDQKASFAFAQQVWLSHAAELANQLPAPDDFMGKQAAKQQLALLESKLENWHQTGLKNGRLLENLTAANYRHTFRSLIEPSKAEVPSPNQASDTNHRFDLAKLASDLCMSGINFAATAIEDGLKKLRPGQAD